MIKHYNDFTYVNSNHSGEVAEVTTQRAKNTFDSHCIDAIYIHYRTCRVLLESQLVSMSSGNRNGFKELWDDFKVLL